MLLVNFLMRLPGLLFVTVWAARQEEILPLRWQLK